MTVRVYKSTDASAPVLTGQVGSLTSLLDACLVNGYGTQTAAGWSINQTTTNKRGYKQNLTGANNASGMVLYIDDTGPGAGAAREARACGFESMSAITPTGTGQFPTSGLAGSITGGFVAIRKSNTADATARNWVLVANGQSFYLFIESGDNTAPLGVTGFFFGDLKPYKSGDQYAVGIIGRHAENSSTSIGGEAFGMMSLPNANVQSPCLGMSLIGHFIARRHTGVGGALRFGKPSDMSKFVAGAALGSWTGETQTTGALGSCHMGRYNVTGLWQAPNGPDGALWLQPAYVCHEGVMRGYLPGLWIPLHDRPLNHSDTVTVTSGNLSGKSFLVQAPIVQVSNNTDSGCLLIETSDTWS